MQSARLLHCSAFFSSFNTISDENCKLGSIYEEILNEKLNFCSVTAKCQGEH